MAYAALVSLSQTINKLLRNQEFISLYKTLQNLITSIQEHVITLQGFLEDCPQNAIGLEGRIRDATNEAEDIIEVFMLDHHRRDYKGKWSAAHESVTHWLHSEDARKFEELTKEVGSIAGELMEIKNRAAEEEGQLSDPSSVATSSSSRLISPTEKDLMVGLDEDLMAIKGRLFEESSKLQVIPIVGMGGIGKTSIARKAYDDSLNVKYFDICAWVTISQDYNAREILSRLLVSVKAKSSEQSNVARMREIAYKHLKYRRYLIVMDDMWSTEVWDDVRMIFPDDNNGSRVILTTRLLDVATYPCSSSPLHQMRFLDEDQSWNLLRQKVFPQGNCPRNLENIGKEIARSCRGLPLAIVVIAGLLSTVSQTPASWKNIARNVNEVVSRNDRKFADIILSSSYNHLPHHLRPCFLYMGLFREDDEIRVSKLIKLWVAEGFLKLPSGSKSCEEVAEEYLEDIVKRSLVLVIKRKSNGKIKTCSVHDMVRDLCITQAQQEKFLLHIAHDRRSKFLPKSVRSPRRLSVVKSNLDFPKDIYGSHIHTIICATYYRWKWDFLQTMRLLRVFEVVDNLYLFQEPIFELPLQLINLFHLTYLALPYVIEIPAAISNLENLQTLIIYPEMKSRSFLAFGKPQVVRLPFEIWGLLKLRHLVSVWFDDLPNSEAARSAPKDLQTLSKVKNFKCTKEILQMIPNLKKLGICYFRGVDVRDIELENLVHLDRLEKLTLKTNEYLHRFCRMVKPVFPTTLKKLTLSGKQCYWKDIHIIGSLPNLEVLKLKRFACRGSTWETHEGGFSQLKYLLIHKSCLKHWITGNSHFRSLKCPVLQFCGRLNEIPDCIGEIPTLELIETDDWNGSLVDSAQRIQEEQQENWGNDALQIRCTPWSKSRQSIN